MRRGYIPPVGWVPQLWFNFLLIYGKIHPLRNTAADFLYQYTESWLYTHGCAIRWLGGVKPKEADPGFIVGIAFGKLVEPTVRGAYEFKRKSLDEMSKGTGLQLEATRLAPSRMNGQPWYHTVDGSKIHICYKLNFRGILGKIYNLMDLVVGISLCHLAVVSEHEGRPSRFAVYQGDISAPPNRFVYMGAVK